jgi:hypothetical protein
VIGICRARPGGTGPRKCIAKRLFLRDKENDINIKVVRKAHVFLALPLLALVLAGCPTPLSSSSTKAITAFGFLAQNAVGVISEASGIISVPVPYGTAVTSLVASFVTNGTAVTVGSIAQVSGTTANDFSSPVTYVVSAADGTTKSYTVTVTVQPSSAKVITNFGFPAQSAVGVINEAGGTISVVVPPLADLTTLVAAYGTTGASVKVGLIVQVNGTSQNNFTNPVTYVVYAADGSTKSYVVTVTFPSTDATLWNMVLSDTLGGTYSYSPAFSPSTTLYDDANSMLTVSTLTYTLTLTTTDPNATITSVFQDAASLSHAGSVYTLQFDMSRPQTIAIVVTAQDGTTTQTYTFKVYASWTG